MSEQKKRRELWESFKYRKVAFFTGAGVSFSYPASLPLGNQISTTILDLVLTKSTINKDPHFNKIENWIRNQYSSLPMEFAWELLIRTTGPDILSVLNMFTTGKPNLDHIAIAATCEYFASNIIFTLNFDSLQEMAINQYTPLEPVAINLEKDYYKYRDFHSITKMNSALIIHLHNAISDESSVDNLAATINNVGIKLPIYKAKFFKRVLLDHDILCAGYSNEDIDTFPIIKQSRNRIFWYSHTGKLSQNVLSLQQQIGDRFIILQRVGGEKGFHDVLSSITPFVNKKILSSGIIQKENGTEINQHLHQIKQNIIRHLGNNNTQRKYSSIYFLAALCDELGNRDAASELISLNPTRIHQNPHLAFSQFMLLGHTHERLGDIPRSIKMYKNATKTVSSRELTKRAELEAASASLGYWKRMPIRFGSLFYWIRIIRKLSNNIEDLSRIEWELGDFYHFIAEYLLVPSSLVLRACSGKIPPILLPIITYIDNLVCGINKPIRTYLLSQAGFHYTKAYRLNISSSEQAPGFIGLAIIRFAEVLAILGKTSQSFYALKLSENSIRFYNWVKSEHGYANVICTKGIVLFYSGNSSKAIDELEKAKMQYGSHSSGVFKSQTYIFRAKNWKI